jgi:dTDP-4-dehydrorhamnose 3,5-epimerase
MTYPIDPQATLLAGLGLDDFKPDLPKTPPRIGPALSPANGSELIDGVIATAVIPKTDPRGALFELLTTRDASIDPIVHVYQVVAEPGSIRAWVYHRHQNDRLVYTNGCFEVVLYDIRPDSPTMNTLNVFHIGEEQPCLLDIPPFVIHGVCNTGATSAFFMNMPTHVYDPDAPDKHRLPWNDPRIPYAFDAS